MDEFSEIPQTGGGCFSVPPLPQTQAGPRGEKEPKNTRLKQQSMPACKPVLDTVWVVFIYLSIGVVLIPIGAVCLVYGQKPVEVASRYDQTCFPQNQSQITAGSSDAEREQYIWQNANNDAALSCTLTLTITDDMPAPVYIFYEMTGFLQNHRRYVISRSDLQLVAHDNPDTSTCDPQLNYMDNSSQVINPCGLTAWTYFNDTYLNWQVVRGGAVVGKDPGLVSTSGIADSDDKKYLFADYLPQWFNPIINQYRGGATINQPVNQDEHFMVWMRLAPLPNFRKTWGIINDQNLVAGDTLQLTIVNRYNSYSYDGQKSIVVSTVTWLGVKNPFLGIVFLVTGSLGVVTGMVYFVVATWVRPRRLGDLSVLPESEWSK